MPQQNHGLQTFEYHFKFFQLYHNYFSFISLGWENWKYPQKYSIDNFGSSENSLSFSIPSPVREQLQSTLTRMCCVPGRHF